jgi:hypothetical protein
VVVASVIVIVILRKAVLSSVIVLLRLRVGPRSEIQARRNDIAQVLGDSIRYR